MRMVEVLHSLVRSVWYGTIRFQRQTSCPPRRGCYKPSSVSMALLLSRIIDWLPLVLTKGCCCQQNKQDERTKSLKASNNFLFERTGVLRHVSRRNSKELDRL